jgi:hypothetical protein
MSLLNWEFESRLDRAFKQRIYLMNAEKKSEDTFSFIVMGASGKPYNLLVGLTIQCSCPDHTQSHKLCKHLLFLLIRVLKQSRNYVKNNYFNKPIFMTKKDTFELCNKYLEDGDILIENDGKVSQRPIEDEDCCPICFEDFNETKESIVYCKSSCGKSVHLDCFMKWVAKKNIVTCVYCRSEWIW